MDHLILLGEIKFGAYIANENNIGKILNWEIVNNNYWILNNIIKGNNLRDRLMNLRKKVYTKANEEHYDIIKFFENYNRLKNEIKKYGIKNIKRWILFLL